MGHEADPYHGVQAAARVDSMASIRSVSLLPESSFSYYVDGAARAPRYFRREPAVIEGGCLCGGVRYQYDGEITEISICHCSQCRKAQGSAFAAVSPVESARFRLIAGAELLKEYRSSADKARVFCATCGSPIYSAKDDLPGIKRLRLGTVDTPFICDNAFHIFIDSKASWWELDDTHPRFAERKT